MTMLTRFLENPAAERFARALLHFLWQGLAAAIVAWLLLAALRRCSAQARYASLLAVFAVLAGSPVVTLCSCHSNR